MIKQNSVRFLAWAMVVVMPLWFGNCSKKSDDAVTPSTSSIEGSWQISGMKIDPAFDLTGTGKKTNDLLGAYGQLLGADIVTCLTTTKINFLAGGKLTETPGSKCTSSSTSTDPISTGSSSTWKLNGSKLTITDGSGSSEVFDTALSGNTLKMSQTDSSTDYDGDGKKDTVTLTLELTKA